MPHSLSTVSLTRPTTSMRSCSDVSVVLGHGLCVSGTTGVTTGATVESRQNLFYLFQPLILLNGQSFGGKPQSYPK